MYTRRDGGAMQPAYSSLATNPTTWGENNFMGKLVFRPTENDTIRLVGEYYQNTQNTEVLSNVGDFPSLFAKIYDEWGRDRTQRSRISAQWVHDAPVGFIDRIDLLAYFTQLIRQEDTMTLRGTNNSVIPRQLPLQLLLVHPEHLRRRAAAQHQRQAVRPVELLHLRPVLLLHDQQPAA